MVVNLHTAASSEYFNRTETLKQFYASIRNYKILTQEEVMGLFDVIKHSKDRKAVQEARNSLIHSNQRFVVAIAKRYGNNNNVLDLIEEGNLGLIEAIDAFKCEKGDSFLKCAAFYIRRAINQYCIKHGNIVKQTNRSKTYHVVAKATNKFIQKEFRQPSLDELAEIIKNDYGVHIKDLADIMPTRISSIDEGFNDDSDDGMIGETALYNSYSASNNTYETTASQDYAKSLIESLLTNLDSKDRERDTKIIKLLFGIGVDRAYEIQEVGEIMNLTTERVRQIKKDVLSKLKKSFKQKVNLL